MTIGIILAAGKGTRIKSKNENKTSLLFNGKSLIQYGLNLFQQVADKTIIVVGAFAESVKKVVPSDPNIYFAHQYHRLGTGHAVVVAIKEIEKLGFTPDRVIVGYGDHMMFYTKKIIVDLMKLHEIKHAVATLISTEHDDPDTLVWGRIIRDENGHVTAIIEQKDATAQQRKVTELNAGFYCFDYQFLKKNYKKLKKSPVTGEYYINDFIHLAAAQHLTVAALKVPFQYVGIGVNTKDELEKSQK